MSTGYLRPGTGQTSANRRTYIRFQLTIEDRGIVEILGELLGIHGGA